MSDPVEYELTTKQLALLDELFAELKEFEIHNAALRRVKAELKELAAATGAHFFTVDGKRVIQIHRVRPVRFDVEGLKAYDPRIHETFMRPSDDTVVSLRVLKGKP